MKSRPVWSIMRRMKQTDPQFKLRLPTDLKQLVEEAAKANNRSMNAEIVARLQDSFTLSMQNAPEPRKVELLTEYDRWMLEEGHKEGRRGSYKRFAELYNGGDPDGEHVDFVADIDQVDYNYLKELALAWHFYIPPQYVDDNSHWVRPLVERRKGELYIGFLEWCKNNNLDPEKAQTAFANEYNTHGTRETLGRITDIPEITPQYLRELHLTWGIEVPEVIASKQLLNPEGPQPIEIIMQAQHNIVEELSRQSRLLEKALLELGAPNPE